MTATVSAAPLRAEIEYLAPVRFPKRVSGRMWLAERWTRCAPSDCQRSIARSGNVFTGTKKPYKPCKI